jgi:hypothetical protein
MSGTSACVPDGAAELPEPADVVFTKARQLADLLKAAAFAIAFTGAGISTAAGIPDFRDPTGEAEAAGLLPKPSRIMTVEITSGESPALNFLKAVPAGAR